MGYPAKDWNNAVSTAIGAQIVAGLCAVVRSTKMRPFTVCLVGTLSIIGCIATFLTFTNIAVLYLTLTLFSFVWMFVPPFQMPLLIELDPSLRSAMFIGTAQLSGVAFGPILAAQAITFSTIVMAANSSIVLALLSIGFLFMTRLWRGRSIAPQSNAHLHE